MKKHLVIAFASIAGVVAVAGSSPASAVVLPKVTICHRTHAVSNPYVRITVSQNAVGNGNGKHGGNSHDDYSNVLFPGGKPVPNVFNPAVTYSPAPEKKWGDIIAPTAVDGSALQNNAAVVAGLNNVGIGASIFNGVGAYFGLCKGMTARDYYDLEVGEGGQNPADVLAEMEDSDSDEWAAARAACVASGKNGFTLCDPATLGAPTPGGPPAPPAPAPPAPSPAVAPTPEGSTKVTICHRTHSITNPYVRITVSQRAVGNGNGKHGGASHDQWSSVLFPSKPAPNVFNPDVKYTPPTEKKWGDIIAWTDVNGDPLVGGAAAVAGLNNTGIGAAIFLGTGKFAGVCKLMNAREFFDVETGDGGQTPAEVLAEMDEMESDEWADAKSRCGGSFKGCSPDKLGTASSKSNVGKVTICHRTHSVTNPYVRITVSQNSLGNGIGKHGGSTHDQWSSVLFSSKPVPNVFNPAVTYSPPTEKKWGDIIAKTDVQGNPLVGDAALVAGLNNTGIGAQIFDGTGAYAGLCEGMTPKQFYEVETGPGGRTPEEVLDDMEDSGADEFADAKNACGGTFKGCSPIKFGVSPNAPRTRRLRGTLWIDANRDGLKAPIEKVLTNYPVVILPGPGNTSGKSYTAITDANGDYEVPNIPAGTWIVRPAALPSTNYQQVYDTDSGVGRADWSVRATVPPAGEAVADFAAALSPTAVANGVTDNLGSTPVAQKLRGSLWVDANRDGVKSPGEKILANYPISIVPGPGNTSGKSFSAITDGAGNFEVPNIPAGNWIVKPAALPNPNYEPVYDTDSGLDRPDWSSSATVPPGGEGVADFAAALKPAAAANGTPDDLGVPPLPQRLRGTMWIDANRDGVKGPSEKVLANYPIVVIPGPGNTSGKSYTVNTDANGNYEIPDIPAGIWIVRPAALPSTSYQQVYDSDSGVGRVDWSVRAVVPPGGEGVADFAAALTPNALAAGTRDNLGSTPAAASAPRLRGSLWVDANRDGLRDPQEKVLTNYPLAITPGPGNTSGKSFTIATDANGNYRLADLPPGNWIVKPAPLANPNYEQVFDSDSGAQGADWQVSVSVPANGEGVADFAAALSQLALQLGAPDVLGVAPAQPRLPVTGIDSTLLVWIALLLVTSGYVLIRRRRELEL